MILAAHADGAVQQQLPAEKNAYTLWTNAMPEMAVSFGDEIYEMVYKACDFYTPLSPDERKKFDAWLESRKKEILLIDKGIALDQLQVPFCGFDDKKLLSEPSFFRHIARVKFAMGAGCYERREYSDSAKAFIDVFRIGSLVEDCDRSSIHFLAGTAIKSLGLTGMRYLASREKVPSAISLKMLHELPAQDDGSPVLARVFHNSFTQDTIAMIKMIEEDMCKVTNRLGVDVSHTFDRTNTIEIAEKIYSRYVANAMKSWIHRDTSIRADIKKQMSFLETDDADLCRGFLFLWPFDKVDNIEQAKIRAQRLAELGRKHHNILGNCLMDFCTPALDGVHKSSVRQQAEINLTRAFLALWTFRKEHGSWPASLQDDRMKSIIARVPIDLFCGKPVLYSGKKEILWSVGADGNDEGGDAQTDIVIELLTGTRIRPPRVQ